MQKSQDVFTDGVVGCCMVSFCRMSC